jgi:hypothetical protein
MLNLCGQAGVAGSSNGASGRVNFRFLRGFAILLMAMVTLQAVAQSSQHLPMMDAAKVKRKLAERGVGNGVKIVKVNDSDVKGKILAIGDATVTVKDGQKVEQTIAFNEVAQVHGPGLSKGATIAIAVGAVVVVLAIVAIIIGEHAGPNFKTAG